MRDWKNPKHGRKCDVDGCTQCAITKGLCDRHYRIAAKLLAGPRISKEKNRIALRRHKYGLTSGQYELMKAIQDGVCWICGQPESLLANDGAVRDLCVDHDSDTGLVRGLLCNNCNVGIARFGHKEGLLMRAAEYLSQERQDIFHEQLPRILAKIRSLTDRSLS